MYYNVHMAIRRTRQQKIQAELRREQSYQWTDLPSESAKKKENSQSSTAKKERSKSSVQASQSSTSSSLKPHTINKTEMHWLGQDMKKTAVATLFVVLLLLGAILSQ
jgi:hypothetical protein